jgi:unsaturated chondroitin disaccharide hydrolase
MRLAETWLHQLGGRACPPWDFTDPADAPTEDSSAAAIMAAALFDIGMLYPDPKI